MNPVLRMVNQVKAENGPAVLVLAKMGDFYEAFGDDAKALAGEPCNLTLTSRQDRDGERVPMAGFPVHTLDRYTQKLAAAGFRVAVCEVTA